MKKVTNNLEKIIKPFAIKNGFNEVRIFSCWKNLIGSELHSQVKPVKLKNKTLHVMAQNSTVATDVAFKSPVIIEKINQFFGYMAVNKLTVVQKPFSYDDYNKVEKIIPDNACYTRAKAMCADVKDETLKKSLTELMAVIEKETILNFNKNINKDN